MILPDVAAAVMLAALIAYALLAGADFGGGIWDLLASGPRAAAQRKLIESAIAPVWEANHVWLIFVVVVLFTGFPAAFAVAGVALHLPLFLMLIGIVLRGSAFVFRQYGMGDAQVRRRWGALFAISSIVTPFFLGTVVGAITSGEIRVVDGMPTTGFFAGWIGVFPFSVGVLAIVLFAFLAATYLTCETDDPALRADFRARALFAGVLLAPVALVAALSAAGPGATHFAGAFLHSPWTWPLQLATGAAAITALVALWRSRFRLARAAAALQVSLILLGWGLAQRPYLIAPDVTLTGAAAPARTLSLMLGIVGAGAFLLVPSLYAMFRVLKSRR